MLHLGKLPSRGVSLAFDVPPPLAPPPRARHETVHRVHSSNLTKALWSPVNHGVVAINNRPRRSEGLAGPLNRGAKAVTLPTRPAAFAGKCPAVGYYSDLHTCRQLRCHLEATLSRALFDMRVRFVLYAVLHLCLEALPDSLLWDATIASEASHFSPWRQFPSILPHGA
jgi:hypothetical protein